MGCVHRDTTAHIVLWNIPIPVNRNCLDVSMAVYGPISIRESEIMNRSITAKVEPFHYGERMNYTSFCVRKT